MSEGRGSVQELVVGIGSDDLGFALKQEIVAMLKAEPGVMEVRDFGVPSAEDLTPYPIIALAAAERFAAGEVGRVILICGTGLGMAISANKVPGVRAAVAYDQYSVERSVLSNDCQVLCMGARVVTPELARRIVHDWLTYRFDPSSPSSRKIAIISQYEQRRSVSGLHEEVSSR